jgi:hypothetical protein
VRSELRYGAPLTISVTVHTHEEDRRRRRSEYWCVRRHRAMLSGPPDTAMAASKKEGLK